MSYKRISPQPVVEGGTGASTLTGVLTGNGTSAITANAVTQYGTVIAGASNAVSSVAPSATSGVPYISQGAASNPTFGTAVVAGGGTGIVTTTAYAPICGGTTATGAFQAASTGLSTSGNALVSNGASALPSFQTKVGTLSGDSGSATGNTITIAGTTNEVTTSASGSTVTISLPNIYMDADDVYMGLSAGNASNPGFNVFIGPSVGTSCSAGQGNVAMGYLAYDAGNNNNNTIIGNGAGGALTSGAQNCVLGQSSLARCTTGTYNTIIGAGNTSGNRYPGYDYTGSESHNLVICNPGVTGESNVIRIGTQGTGNAQQNKCFIAGITGTSVTAAGSMVVVDSSGQLGTDYSTINIATAATAKAITLGTTTTTTSLAVNFGTGDATFASATGNIMVMADTGEITKPLQPSFLAYLGTTVTNATGAGTSWQLGTTTALTEVFDRNADFNTNGTFTAPVTGLYQLNVTIRVTDLTSAMTQGYVQITTTARSYQGGFCNPYAGSAGTAYSFSYSVLADMSATNTATFNVVISNGAGDTADIVGSASPYATFVSGYLVA